MTSASLHRPPAILLVDDDEAFRSSIVRLLHMSPAFRSAAVRQASNGAEAVDYLRQNRPDCLLLDYQMPGENGLHWLRRAREKQAELPVIMITGEGSEEVAVEAMKSGATDYLVKGSITAEALYRALSNALDKARMQRTIREQEEQLLEAERHRVMIESLAAACHHLGQPATVLLSYLEMLNQLDQSPEHRQMLQESLQAAQSLADILQRLQTVATYRTVPYLAGGGSGEEQRMLDI